MGRPLKAAAAPGQLQKAARHPPTICLVLPRGRPPLRPDGGPQGRPATLRALKAIRASVPDSETIYVILDNLNHHRGKLVRDWCASNAVELVFTPTYASWANPILVNRPSRVGLPEEA